MADAANTGIYEIVNTVTGKRYIGSAVSFAKRWAGHRSDLRLNRHHSRALQRAWNKYGEECFRFSILLNCGPDELISEEQAAFDKFCPEYNTSKFAGSMRGVSPSQETRTRLSAALANRHFSEEHRAKISKAIRKRNETYVHSPDTLAKMRSSQVGKKLSEATKKKMSEARKGKRPALGSRWTIEQRQAQSERLRANPTFLGKTHTDAAKAKISAARCGRGSPHTEEAKRKISEGLRGNQHWLGKSHSDETKAKLSQIHKGRVFSAESLAKMSASHRGVIPSEETRMRMSQARAGRKLSEEHKAACRAGWERRRRAKEIANAPCLFPPDNQGGGRN